MMEKIKFIEIEYSDAAMWGSDFDPDVSGVNIEASFARWEELLHAALTVDYAHAEITIRNTINDCHHARLADGWQDNGATADVGQTINDVWTEWTWVVKKK